MATTKKKSKKAAPKKKTATRSARSAPSEPGKGHGTRIAGTGGSAVYVQSQGGHTVAINTNDGTAFLSASHTRKLIAVLNRAIQPPTIRNPRRASAPSPRSGEGGASPGGVPLPPSVTDPAFPEKATEGGAA